MVKPLSSSDRTTQHALRAILPPFVLVIATFLVYSVTQSFEFLATWDDKDYLLLNATIKSFTFAHLQEAFTNYYVGNYAPLHILSYMVDHALWGLNPAGYHLENVLNHSLNGFLFYT